MINAVDVTVESVFEDFVKTFDNLASTPESRVKWGAITENSSIVDPILHYLTHL